MTTKIPESQIERVAQVILAQRGLGFYTDPMEGGQDAYDISMLALEEARAVLEALGGAAETPRDGGVPDSVRRFVQHCEDKVYPLVRDAWSLNHTQACVFVDALNAARSALSAPGGTGTGDTLDHLMDDHLRRHPVAMDELRRSEGRGPMEAWRPTGRCQGGIGWSETEWFRQSDGVRQMHPTNFNPNTGRYEGLPSEPAPASTSPAQEPDTRDAGKARCTATGNTCGTDTVRRGDTCPDRANGFRCKYTPATATKTCSPAESGVSPSGRPWITVLCLAYCGDERCNCECSPYHPSKIHGSAGQEGGR